MYSCVSDLNGWSYSVWNPYFDRYDAKRSEWGINSQNLHKMYVVVIGLWIHLKKTCSLPNDCGTQLYYTPATPPAWQCWASSRQAHPVPSEITPFLVFWDGTRVKAVPADKQVPVVLTRSWTYRAYSKVNEGQKSRHVCTGIPWYRCWARPLFLTYSLVIT